MQTRLTIADDTSACLTYHNQPSQWKMSQFLYYCGFVKASQGNWKNLLSSCCNVAGYKNSAVIRLNTRNCTQPISWANRDWWSI